MRVLVTGHKGYIGTVLVPMLLDAGHDVVGLDSDLFEGCSYDQSAIRRIPEMQKDVRDITVLDLDGFDVVIHLANLSNDPLGNLNPHLTFDINHEASVRLAALARQAGVRRFLFASSCSLYGAAGADAVTEEAPFNPVTPYGVAKVYAERDISKFADDGFSPTFFRNATAYGVSPRFRFDLVVNNLVAWALATGSIYIKSDGTPWRPLVHVRDISAAMIASLDAERSRVHNQAFNVGQSSENYQIRDIAEVVERVVPNCTVEYAVDASPDTRSYRVDFSKISRVLPEFEPVWTIERGVAEIYESLRQRALTPEDFEGPRFRRIDHIKQLLKEGALGDDLRWIYADSLT